MPGQHFQPIPESLSHIDLGDIQAALIDTHANVYSAASALGVPAVDLRRLTRAHPQLIEIAIEAVEQRLDLAERNLDEALHSDDSRRRDAAAHFILRNSIRSNKRGWITSSSAAVDLTIAAGPQRETVYHWRKDDAEVDRAEVSRLVEEGKQVISIGWGSADADGLEVIERDGKQIPVPRYGAGRSDDDGCLEGEVTTPAAMIEHEHQDAIACDPEPVAPDVGDEHAPTSPASESPAVRYERERIDAWIRNRLIAYPLASCFGCRKPICVGQEWQEVSNGEARARFHRTCHAEWRTEREAAARQALGLEG